jgi:argininosuccinate synthase
MAEINKENLENALGPDAKEEFPKMPKDVEIGFHQGSVTTLVNERNELVRMIANVEAIIQAHIKRLEELGVKVKNKKEE